MCCTLVQLPSNNKHLYLYVRKCNTVVQYLYISIVCTAYKSYDIAASKKNTTRCTTPKLCMTYREFVAHSMKLLYKMSSNFTSALYLFKTLTVLTLSLSLMSCF